MNAHPIVILTGPSGAGKSTIAKALLERHSEWVRFITTTTRAPRPGEKPGSAYRFIPKDAFKRGIEENRFFEWAEVYDELYGSDKQELERLRKTGKTILLILDIQGAKTVKNLVPEARVIFIDAPETELEKRLRARTGREKNIDMRLHKMAEERAFRDQADFTVTNHDDELEHTIQLVENIVKTLETENE